MSILGNVAFSWTGPFPFFSRDRDFYRDSDRDTDRSKYQLFITFIHISPQRDIHRDSDWYWSEHWSGPFQCLKQFNHDSVSLPIDKCPDHSSNDTTLFLMARINRFIVLISTQIHIDVCQLSWSGLFWLQSI